MNTYENTRRQRAFSASAAGTAAPSRSCDSRIENASNPFKSFLVNKADPPAVLLLSGIISKDGDVELETLYMVENG